MNIAGFDIGTNTTRFLLLKGGPTGPLTRLTEELAFTRTGEGLASTGRIGDSAIARTADAMKSLMASQGLAAGDVRGYVTESFRRAQNGPDQLQRLRELTGVDVIQLTSAQEAEAGLAAIEASFDEVPDHYAVIDVGGGSTEVLLKQRETTTPLSSPMGSVVFTDTYLPHDPPTTEDIAACRNAARQQFETRYAFTGHHPAQLFAVGGTATTAAQIIRGDIPYDPEQIHGLSLHHADLNGLIERLGRLSIAERLRYRSLPKGRADVALAGAIILEAGMEALGVNAATISAEGILYGRLARILRETP